MTTRTDDRNHGRKTYRLPNIRSIWRHVSRSGGTGWRDSADTARACLDGYKPSWIQHQVTYPWQEGNTERGKRQSNETSVTQYTCNYTLQIVVTWLTLWQKGVRHCCCCVVEYRLASKQNKYKWEQVLPIPPQFLFGLPLDLTRVSEVRCCV